MLQLYMFLLAVVNLMGNLIYKLAASNNLGFFSLTKSKFIIVCASSIITGGKIELSINTILQSFVIFIAEFCFYKGISTINTYGLAWYFCVLPFISNFLFQPTIINLLIVFLTVLLAPQWSPWILSSCVCYSIGELLLVTNRSSTKDIICTQAFLISLFIPANIIINSWTINIACNNLTLLTLLTYVLTKYNYYQILPYRVFEVVGNYLFNQWFILPNQLFK